MFGGAARGVQQSRADGKQKRAEVAFVVPIVWRKKSDVFKKPTRREQQRERGEYKEYAARRHKDLCQARRGTVDRNERRGGLLKHAFLSAFPHRSQNFCNTFAIRRVLGRPAEHLFDFVGAITRALRQPWGRSAVQNTREQHTHLERRGRVQLRGDVI